MILSLFRKNNATEPVFAVYRAIVAQSRHPIFYAEWDVPDTVTGRFDMISLHLMLLFRRLRGEGKQSANFSQAVFDLFFRDMDQSLREMGVSDLGVPKKIQKMGNLFYGLLAAANAAIDRDDADALEAVIVRNIYDGAASAACRRLATYLMAEAKALDAQPASAILAGTLQMGSSL